MLLLCLESERTENSFANNVDSNRGPWLFYHYFHSFWSHYADTLLRVVSRTVKQWLFSFIPICKIPSIILLAGVICCALYPVFLSLLLCVNQSSFCALLPLTLTDKSLQWKYSIQSGYSSQCHLVVFFLKKPEEEMWKRISLYYFTLAWWNIPMWNGLETSKYWSKLRRNTQKCCTVEVKNSLTGKYIQNVNIK